MVRDAGKGMAGRWLTEYGDPSKEEEFQSLLHYSPYHNVRKGTVYPAILVMSPEADDRVDPMHSRKFAAVAQAAETKGPVLLDLERAVGHNLTDDRSIIVEVKADMYAFALAQSGSGSR